MGWTPPTKKDFAHAKWVDEFLGVRRPDLIKAFAPAQNIPGLKLAAKLKMPCDGSGGDFAGFTGRLPQGVFDGAVFRGAVITYIPEGNSFRRSDFTDATLPAFVHENFSGACLDGVVCSGSPLSISGNFSGVDLTRVAVDLAAAISVILRGAWVTKEMVDSVLRNVPIPNLVGIRGPGAEEVLATIELVHRMINVVEAMGLPGTSGLIDDARTATPKAAARMLKRHLRLWRRRCNTPPGRSLYAQRRLQPAVSTVSIANRFRY
jgi:hypothetical protein